MWFVACGFTQIRTASWNCSHGNIVKMIPFLNFMLHSPVYTACKEQYIQGAVINSSIAFHPLYVSWFRFFLSSSQAICKSQKPDKFFTMIVATKCLLKFCNVSPRFLTTVLSIFAVKALGLASVWRVASKLMHIAIYDT